MDSRRAEFRRWLDYEGILDAFTKLFVTLFEEDQWPDDPIDYARNFFKATPKEEIDAAVAENESLKREIAETEAKIADIKKQLEEGDD